MRKLTIALGVMAAVSLAGGAVMQADASAWKAGTFNLPSAAKNYSPIEKTACYGWGKYCPLGFHWSATAFVNAGPARLICGGMRRPPV